MVLVVDVEWTEGAVNRDDPRATDRSLAGFDRFFAEEYQRLARALFIVVGDRRSRGSRPGRPTVTLVNGGTGEVLAGPLSLPASEHTPGTIFAFNGHAWIGFHDTGTLVRIDISSSTASFQESQATC